MKSDEKPASLEPIDQLYGDTRPSLVSYAQRKWGLDDDDAEDLAHDALTQAWYKRDKFTDRGEGSFFGWVCKIMENKRKDQGKKKALFLNKNACSIDKDTAGEKDLHESIRDPKSQFEYQEIEIDIDRGILYRNGNLSQQEADVLRLADQEELKASEIAEQLNLKTDLVYKALHRARKKMRNANSSYAY